MSESNANLINAFDKYLSMAQPNDARLIYDQRCRDDLYMLASSLLKDLQVSPEDAHELLRQREFSADEKDHAGFFVSAVYNKSDISDIVYDLDVEIHNLAYCLPENKSFVNKGNGFQYSGTKAKGIVVNYVKQGTFLTAGFAADGPVITYGAQPSTGYWVGDFDENDESFVDSVSLDVSLDKILCIKGSYDVPKISDVLSIKKNKYSELPDLILNEDEIRKIPELHNYVSNLKSRFEQGKNDYRAVLETVRGLGPKPNEKLRQDIEAILQGAGKNV
jgi:hypothetical protein